jgi:ribosomal protein S12 methylthiotransferase accessory factor YcaO
MENSVFHFHSRIKYLEPNGTQSQRTRSAKQTIKEFLPLCKKIGITRISNITFLDRLRIPNYSAVLPGTEDSIWVYSGKGTTVNDAKASALMEAVERFSSLSSNYSGPVIRGNYFQLSRSYPEILHPSEVVEPVSESYDKDSISDFVPAMELFNSEKILVPADLVLYKYVPRTQAVPTFPFSHTNGLASGNVVEEAISHGLCELIERDASSIADLSASSLPYTILDRVFTSFQMDRYSPNSISPRIDDVFVDDSNIFPDVEIDAVAEEFEPIKFLLGRFSEEGIPVLVKDITQRDIGIATFVASCVEWITSDYGLFVKGYGAHPDSRIALVRAISEVSQTRAANIQGARDDLKRIVYRKDGDTYKRKWQFMHSERGSIKFSAVKTRISEDILDDIRYMLERLRQAKLKRVIAADLTNPRCGIPVVRVIVPGLETFDVTSSIMGDRAINYFSGARSKARIAED